MVDITVGIAFIAGLVSFISPCVLPLVPAYIGYMGGQVTTQVAATAGSGAVVARRYNRFNTLMHGLFFVLGFTVVFVTFGLLTTAGSLALRGTVINVQDILGRLGGLIIIIFGLHVMGLLPRFVAWVLARTSQMNAGIGYALTLATEVAVGVVLAWSLVTPVAALVGGLLFAAWLVLGGALTRPGDFWQRTLTRLQNIFYVDTRRQMEAHSEAGYLGSALMGVVFSAGWTPCIGPVYGAVLTLAANGGSLSQAGILLAAYALGLGVPFLLTAVALDQFQGLLRRLQRQMRTIELVSGVFLVLIGLLVMSGQLQLLSQYGANGDFSLSLEHCTTELFSGRMGLGEFGACMNVGLNYVPEADRETSAAPETSPAVAQVPAEVVAESPALTSPALESAAATDGQAAASGLLESLRPLESDGLAEVGLDEGLAAPDFQSMTVDGQPVSLAEARGHVVVLNFWATWCAPCQVEMPDLQAAYERHAGDGLEVLAINRGEAAGSVADFRDQLGVSFPLVMDQDERITAGVYQVVSMPTTYVIDADGIIVARHYGLVTAEQLEGYLQAAIYAGRAAS